MRTDHDRPHCFCSQFRNISMRSISGQPDENTCKLISVSGPLNIRCSNQLVSRIRSTQPAATRSRTYASSSAESIATRSMSIIGLATRPGTAVGHLRVPDLPRVSDALNEVLHLREFTNDSSGGIENDVVKKCSRGWVPS